MIIFFTKTSRTLVGDAILGVCVPFLFGDLDMIWNSIALVPYHCFSAAYSLRAIKARTFPEKISSSPEAQNYFPNPECLKNKTQFLICVGVFTNFDKTLCQKSANFVKNMVLWSKVSKCETDVRCSPEKMFLEKWSCCALGILILNCTSS